MTLTHPPFSITPLAVALPLTSPLLPLLLLFLAPRRCFRTWVLTTYQFFYISLSPVFRPNERLPSFNFQKARWDGFASYFDSHCPSAEELPFCSELKTTTKAKDVMAKVENFFDKENISWASLCGVCTDGAPTMSGAKSGFQTFVKNKASNLVTTHCFIHREALASKTLPDAHKCVFDVRSLKA